MHKTNVVFITSQQLNSRNIERIQALYLAKISSLTIFDVSKLFNPSAYCIQQEEFNHSFNLEILIISDLSDFRRHLDLFKDNDLFICWTGGNTTFYNRFYDEITFLSHKTLILAISTFPKHWRDGSTRFAYRLLCKIMRERLYFIFSLFSYLSVYYFFGNPIASHSLVLFLLVIILSTK